MVDSEVQTRMDATKVALKDVAACTVAYKDLGCDKTKSGADCAWACAYHSKVTDEMFGCTNANATTGIKDSECSVNDGARFLACESMSTMFTAVCDKTAAEIETLVAKMKCKNKADGGQEFSPPKPSLTPTSPTAAAGGLSPMWSLGLAACLVSAAASK
jgi:hypothetical protein